MKSKAASDSESVKEEAEVKEEEGEVKQEEEVHSYPCRDLRSGLKILMMMTMRSSGST